MSYAALIIHDGKIEDIIYKCFLFFFSLCPRAQSICGSSTETPELGGMLWGFFCTLQIEAYFHSAGIIGRRCSSSQQGIIKFILITQQEPGRALILVPVHFDGGEGGKTAEPP